MTDNNRLTDLAERLRDKAFKRCGPTMEAIHTKTDEWKAADAIEELMAALDKANQSTKDWLSATADEKLENKRLIKKVSGLIQEGLMLVGKVEQRDDRIAALEAALKPFAHKAEFYLFDSDADDAVVEMDLIAGHLRAARAAYLGEKE
jgi:hypothetical protein